MAEISKVKIDGAEYDIRDRNALVGVQLNGTDLTVDEDMKVDLDLFVDDVHYSTDTTKTATAAQIWTECAKRNVKFVESGSIEDLVTSQDERDFINQYAYGVTWAVNGSTVTEAGNATLLSQMPIHNAIKACVYDIMPGSTTVTEDGYSITYGAKRVVRYFLDDDNWEVRADTGGEACLTGVPIASGSIGSGIALYHPRFYHKCFTHDVVYTNSDNTKFTENTLGIFISLVQYDSTWKETKEGYVDFSKMQTETINGKIYARSFGNPDFTVTNPSTSEMSYADMKTWMVTQKGTTISNRRSLVSTSRSTAHAYALNSGAHLMSLDEYAWIQCWLPLIEFKTFKLDSDVYTWSGNGGSSDDSVMTRPDSCTFGWAGIYSANYPNIVNNLGGWGWLVGGYSNALGTHTGWVKIKLPNASDSYDDLCVSRWRGMEIQRSIWTNLYGVNPVQTYINTEETHHYCDVYTTNNRAMWNDQMPIATVSDDNYTRWSTAVADFPVRWSNTSRTYELIDGWEYAGTQVWNGSTTEFATDGVTDSSGTGEIGPFAGTVGSSYKYDYSYGSSTVTNPRWFIAGGALGSGANGGPFYFTSSYSASVADGAVGFRCCWNSDEYTSIYN